MRRGRGRPPYPGILTPREQEVLELLRQGLSNEEIAERLEISLAGAKFHVSEIISRLGVDSRYEAAEWEPAEGRSWGLAALLSFIRRGSSQGISRFAAKSVLALTALLLALLALGVLVMNQRASTAQREATIDTRTVSLEEADELLHRALLTPLDLPGQGWTVVSNDQFGSQTFQVPACESMLVINDKLERASTRVQRDIESETGISVEITFSAFETHAEAAAIISDYRLLSSQDIAACLTENVKRERFDNDAAVTATAPIAAPQKGGVAFGGEMTLTAPNGTAIKAHGEIQMWRQGNVHVHLILIALQGTDVATLLSDVLQHIALEVDAILAE